MDKIDQILNDPDSMQKIIETASSLGLESYMPEQQTSSSNNSERIAQLLQATSSRSKKEQALFHALLPYLKPGKQRRLEQAMQIAQVSALAGSALKEQFPAIIEGINHV